MIRVIFLILLSTFIACGDDDADYQLEWLGEWYNPTFSITFVFNKNGTFDIYGILDGKELSVYSAGTYTVIDKDSYEIYLSVNILHEFINHSEAGTWERKGKVLTLYSDSGSASILHKIE